MIVSLLIIESSPRERKVTKMECWFYNGWRALAGHPVYPYILYARTPRRDSYMRDRVHTDTSRGDDTDVDGDVPQDVLLNLENGEIEAGHPLLVTRACASVRVELERSGVQGWHRCRGTDEVVPVVLIASKPPSLIPADALTLCKRRRAMYSARDKWMPRTSIKSALIKDGVNRWTKYKYKVFY